MNAFVAPFLSFLLLYKYWALFVLTYVAGLVMPLPMNTIILATGAFAAQGYFSLAISLPVAVFANMLGDLSGYILARKYGKRALDMLRIKQASYIERFERHVRTRLGITVFVTRFVGTLGTLVNLLSGFVGVPIAKFVMYDFFGNLVSIGTVMYFGYFLGIHWQDFPGLFTMVGWIIVGIVAVIGFGMWYIRKRKRIIVL